MIINLSTLNVPTACINVLFKLYQLWREVFQNLSAQTFSFLQNSDL